MSALLVAWLVTGAAADVPPVPAPAPNPAFEEPEVFPRVAADLVLLGALVDVPAFPWPNLVTAAGAHVQVGARVKPTLGVVGVLTILEPSSRAVGSAFATLGAGVRWGRASHVTGALGLTFAEFVPPPSPPLAFPSTPQPRSPAGFGLTAVVDGAWVVAEPLAVHAMVSAGTNGAGAVLVASVGVGLALF